MKEKRGTIQWTTCIEAGYQQEERMLVSGLFMIFATIKAMRREPTPNRLRDFDFAEI